MTTISDKILDSQNGIVANNLSGKIEHHDYHVKSSRCLDELAKIIEYQDLRGQKVLPVFYHLDPSDVYRQIFGDLTPAFHQPHGLNAMDKETQWRKALAAAGNLSGWHISPNNGRESLFINKIVQSILDHMQCDLMENNLVGIDSHIDALKSVLDLEATREVRMVAIWGMAGIGKTTIAQTLFRRILYKFEGGSFVKDVRENYTWNICALLEKILKDMTHHTYMIKDPHHGMMILQERFCYSKVLLVLDDVDDAKQLEFLDKTHNWFGNGSRIIITTKDRHVLDCLRVDCIYECSMLSMEQSLELFCRHAFCINSPPEGFEELSIRAINYAWGVPLALTTLGSQFHGIEESEWESALNRLAKEPNKGIF